MTRFVGMVLSTAGIPEYRYHVRGPTHGFDYVWPEVSRTLAERASPASHSRLIELGCGNGHVACLLDGIGYDVTAVDTSVSGIDLVRKASHSVRAEVASVYDDLRTRFGEQDVAVSLEVIEHLYSPASFAKNVFDLLRPGGVGVISTPYHGYLKNLLLAASGRFDAHWGPLWEGGHIKFWSVRTLTQLLVESGFGDIQVKRVGRFPQVAKSMVVSFRKP